MAYALLLMSFSVFAETRITGKEAENLFNSLEGQYEYTSGALATVSYECIVN